MNGNKEKLLITGGLGNLGSWLTTFLSNDYEVYVISRSKSISLDCKYNLINVDITDYDDLRNKLNIGFDYCIHMASFNEFFLDNYSKKALEINTLGTRNLLEVLAQKELKSFIYFSTFHVYGTNNGVITEETLLNPKNDYASTHLFAEYYVKQFGFTHNLKYTILRLTNSYGCPTFFNNDKWYLALNNLCKQAYENKIMLLTSNGKVKRDFIWMGDVCNIIYKLLEVEAMNEIYNLSSENTFQIIELAKIVKDVYEEKYRNNIDIIINENDKTIEDRLVVKNTKLNSFISFEMKDKINVEINKIFNLIESNYAK